MIQIARKTKKYFFILFLFSLEVNIGATEVDSFTYRHLEYTDSLEVIDDMVNERIRRSIAIANVHACDYARLEKELKKELVLFGWSPMEIAINSNEVISKKMDLFNHIYKYFLIYSPFSSTIWHPMVHSPLLKINDVMMGVDKFSHFFNEGYNYFKIVHKQGKSLDDALRFGRGREKGLWGQKTTGIYSYADLVANYQGYLFWKEIFPFSAEDPYVQCDENGSLFLARSFTFTDYLDDAFDEAINCNTYRFKGQEYAVKKALEELSQKREESLRCPLSIERCTAMQDKYPGLDIINPVCR